MNINSKLNYQKQGEANVLAFFEKDYFDRRNVLFKVLEQFEKHNIEYGLACSANLFFRGITDDFHDFDFIISQQDIPKVKEFMNHLSADLLETGGNGYCESDVYLHYRIDNLCDIDIISGFRLVTFGTSFHYEFSSDEIERVDLEYFSINLISLEALFILYAMMEGWQPRRKFKRIFIQSYLQEMGCKFPSILEDALNNDLPLWIKKEIKHIFSLQV